MNSKLFHQFIEGGPADSEFDGSRGDFTSTSVKSAKNQVALQGFAGFFQGRMHVTAGGGRQFEVGAAEPFAIGHDDGAFDTIFEFADVAGPGMFHQGAESIGTEGKTFLAAFRGRPAEELLSDELDVIFSVAQGGQVDDDDREAIE